MVVISKALNGYLIQFPVGPNGVNKLLLSSDKADMLKAVDNIFTNMEENDKQMEEQVKAEEQKLKQEKEKVVQEVVSKLRKGKKRE